MRISFTKLSDQRHRMSIVRDDGTAESCELETRSFLLHDLVHHAVETEAPIDDGFWGLLARGTTLEELADRERPAPLSPGIVVAEGLVGPMQSVYHGRLPVDLYLENAKNTGGLVIDAAFVERVLARLRRLWGAWRATPFRGSLELDWPARSEPRVRPG